MMQVPTDPRDELTQTEMLAQIFEASTDGIFAFDKNLRITLWNASMERIFGAARERVLGRGVFDIFPFLRAIGEDRCLLGALDGQPSASADKSFVVPETGRRGRFDAFYAPLRSKAGDVIGAHAVIRDITARKDADDQLRETETRFRTMADCAPVLLWMAGTNAECDYFNQVWLDFTGRSMEEEVGVGWAEGVHPEDFQACLDTFMDAFNARRAFTMVYRLRRRDGVYRSILDNGVPRYTPSGAFAGFIGSCIDITDRVLAEAQRTELVAELTRALAAREEFVSIASHELRTPLTSLKLHTQRLLRWVSPDSTLPLEAARLERLAIASHQQVLRLERLTDAMLTGTRLSREGVELVTSPVDLAELARETLERFEGVAESSGATITLVAETPVRGTWDPVCIDQILVNLLMNAVKYGGGRPITVEVRPEYERALLLVQDRGRGVAEEDKRRIFEPFARAVPYSEISGLGLGLYIVKRLTEAHGGRVHVDSREGHGSIFVIELPRDQR